MNTSPLSSIGMQLLLQTLVVQLPLLLVCIAGIAVVLSRWNEGASGSPWALAGFGLAFLLCFAIPAGQVAIQQWMMRGGLQPKNAAWIFTAFAVLWSVLRAVSYLLLLVAVFAGRPKLRADVSSHLQKM